MLSGDNGILQRASDTKEQTEIGQEKEIVALTYNSTLAKKISNGDLTAVTAGDLNIELTNQGATASGSNPIIVTFDSGRKYKISSNGSIEQNLSSSSCTLALTYWIEGTTLQVYPQASGYDEEYYETLTEYFVTSQRYWDGINYSSFADIMEQWEEWENITTSYNSLKDFYQAEYSNEYESCAEFLLDWWDLGYAEYMNEHDSEDGYIEYAETIYNQVQALFPEEYYVTITYDGNTQTIDLASAYQTFNWAGLNNQPMSLYI